MVSIDSFMLEKGALSAAEDYSLSSVSPRVLFCTIDDQAHISLNLVTVTS